MFSSDIQYATVKEKLIGLTVKINLNYEEVYDNLIDKYSSGETKDILLLQKPEIIEIFEILGCHNLRTIIFCISVFEKIFKFISGLENDDEEYNNLIKEEIDGILKYIIYCSIKYKNGFIEENTEDSGKTMFCIKFNAEPYSFIDSFIYTHYLSDDIKEEVKKRVDEKYDERKRKKEHDELSLFKISGFQWLFLNDCEVESIINSMYNELEELKYDERYFKEILSIFYQLDHNNFTLSPETHSVDDFLVLMVEYINQHEVDTHFLDIMEAFGFDDPDGKYDTYVQMLRNAINNKEERDVISDYENIFEGEDWADKFYEYCGANRDVFSSKYCFLTESLSNKVIAKLETASNKQIETVCDSICRVYYFGNLYDFYKSDLVHLNKIIERFDSLSKESDIQKTRRALLTSLLSRLKNKYNIISR